MHRSEYTAHSRNPSEALMSQAKRHVLCLAAIMVLSLVAIATMAGFAMAADAPSEPDVNEVLEPSDAVASQSGDGVVATDSVSDETTPALDFELDELSADDDGEAELILRLGTPDGLSMLSATEAEQTLKSHAELTQDTVTEQIESMDGVEVRNTFWITNAISVDVAVEDVSAANLETLVGVERIHENHEFSLPEPVGDVVEFDSSETATAEGAEAGEVDVDGPVGVGEQGSGTQSSVQPESTDEFTYGLEQINAPDVFDEFENRGDGVRVSVIDTGIDPDHPDIDIDPENFAEFDAEGEQVEDPDLRDTTGHGTHVSGTVVGGDASGTQIGVAPDATLMNVLGLPGGTGSFEQIAASIEWSVDNDADIASLSLGTAEPIPDLIEAVANANEAGTLVVASSGNSGPGTSGSPASEFDAFAVGATGPDEDVAPFSSGQVIYPSQDFVDNFGNPVAPETYPFRYVVPDHAAPGVDVLSAGPLGDPAGEGEATHSLASGTSMAAPHVSGTMALILSNIDRDLNRDEMYNLLTETAFKPDEAPAGQDTRWGNGIIDAFEATTTAVEQDTQTVNGSVLRAGTDEPLPGTVVSADETDAKTVVNEEGEFTLPTFTDEEELTIVAERFGFTTAVAIVDPSDESAEVEFELDAAPEASSADLPSFPLGDVSEDGTVGIADAVAIQRASLGLDPGVDPADDRLFDVLRNEDVGIQDAVRAQRISLGLTEGAVADVTITDAPSNLVLGEIAEVTATVENEGDIGILAGAEFRAAQSDDLDEGTTLDTELVDVGTPETDRNVQEVTFEIDTSELSPGTYSHGVFVDSAVEEQFTAGNDTGSFDLTASNDTNFELEPRLMVDQLDEQPAAIDLTEAKEENLPFFDLQMAVGSADNVTVDITDESDVDPDEIDLTIAGLLSDPGDTVEIEDEQSLISVSASEASFGDVSPGNLSLSFTFQGVGDELTLTTGPTELVEDPEVNFELLDYSVESPVGYGETLDQSLTIRNTGEITMDRSFLEFFVENEAGDEISALVLEEQVLDPGEEFSLGIEIGAYEEFFLPGEYETTVEVSEVIDTFLGPLPSAETYDSVNGTVSTFTTGVSGTVTDAETDDPVPGVTIRAESETTGEEFTAESGDDGVASLETGEGEYFLEDTAMPDGRYVVNVIDTPPNFSIESITQVETNETTTDVNFQVVPDDPEIVGTVTDTRTAGPVEDARVFDADSPPLDFEAFTDEAGEYQVTEVERGDVAIRANASGYEQSRFRVLEDIPAGETEANFQLEPEDPPASEISVQDLGIEPNVGTEEATYDFDIQYDVVGDEIAQFISVDFGDDTVDLSGVGPSDIDGDFGGFFDPSITDVFVLEDGQTLVIQIADGEGIGFDEDQTEIDVRPGDIVEVEIGNVVNPAGGTHNFTVGLHEEGEEILGAAGPAFAADSTQYEILAAPFFEVADLDSPGTATPGETITTTATVENTGDLEGTQTVTYEFREQPEVDGEFDIGVVADPGPAELYTDVIATIEDKLGPFGYSAELVGDEEAQDRVDEFDSFVVHDHQGSFALDETIEPFLEALDDDTGVVFLESQGLDANAVDALAEIREDPEAVEDDFDIGDPGTPVEFNFTADHQLLTDVGAVGDRLKMYDVPDGTEGQFGSSTNQRAWFNNYSGTELAEVGLEGEELDGPSLAVNDNETEVLLSLGRVASVTDIDIGGDDFTDEADILLANAVELMTEGEVSGSPVVGSDEVEITLDGGENTTVSFEFEVPDDLEPDDYDQEVATEQDSETVTITVEDSEPADSTESVEPALPETTAVSPLVGTAARLTP